mgnify:CR=1 FL=1
MESAYLLGIYFNIMYKTHPDIETKISGNMNDLYMLVYILVMERFREFYFNFLFCYSRLCDRVRKGKHIT